MEAWIDGRFIDWRQASVPILSHAFGRGLVIFEVINILATQDGPAFFGLKEHVDRFFNSASLISMDLPITRKELVKALLATARRNNVSAGAGKWFAFYPSVELTPVPRDKRVSIAIFCGDNESFGFDPEKASQPISSGLSSYRKIHPQTVPIKAKLTGHYINAYLGALEMAAKGYDDAIYIDTSGLVAEGGTHTYFFVKDGIIKTPPLERVLPGTTRAAVIEVARAAGHRVEETDIRVEELAQVDEAFCTGSLIKVTPVRAIEGRPLGQVCPGPVTASVAAAMDKVYLGESELHRHWLTLIG